MLFKKGFDSSRGDIMEIGCYGMRCTRALRSEVRCPSYHSVEKMLPKGYTAVVITLGRLKSQGIRAGVVVSGARTSVQTSWTAL